MAHGLLRAGAVAAAFALAGCDLGRVEIAFADLPPTEIVDQGLAAMARLKSVTVEGKEFFENQRVEFEASFDRDRGCDGTIRIGSMGGRANVIVADGDSYVRGNERYWLATAGEDGLGDVAIDRIVDRWVKLPPNQEFTKLCSLEYVLEATEEQLARRMDDQAAFTTMVLAELDGREVVQVQCSGPMGAFTVWVATGPEHFIVSVSGGTDFSRFNEPVEIKAPPADEVLDRSGAAVT